MVCFGTTLRIKPPDQHILAHLLYKVNEKPIPCNDHDFAMMDDLYGTVNEPWDFIDLESRNQDMFYFSRRKRSISNPASFNLDIGKGTWQVCGPKLGIVDKRNQELGFKQSYRYKSEEEIPDRDLGRWAMEEYTLADKFSACVRDGYVDFALCSISFVRAETGVDSDIDGFFDQVLSENRPLSLNSASSARICKAIRRWSKFGNHWAMIILWTILGLVAATVSPIFLFSKRKDCVPCMVCATESPIYISQLKDYAPYMVAAFVATATVYAVGFRIRRHTVMRERMNWWQSIVCNLLVSGITILSSYLHKVSTHAMIGQILIAVAVFVFMEIAKPIFDFGTLQYYLRLPLLTTVQLSPHRISKWQFITGFVLLVGTIWQSIYLHLFNQLVEKERHEAARFDDPPKPPPVNPAELMLRASQGDGLQPILDQSPTRLVE